MSLSPDSQCHISLFDKALNLDFQSCAGVFTANVPVELVGLVLQHTAGLKLLILHALSNTLKLHGGALSRK